MDEHMYAIILVLEHSYIFFDYSSCVEYNYLMLNLYKNNVEFKNPGEVSSEMAEEIYKKYGFVLDKSVSVQYSGLNAMKEIFNLFKGRFCAATLKNNLYFSDYKTLISMNRSNGGATFFCDGYLIRKYARRALPDTGELSKLFQSDETEELISRSTSGDLTFQGFLLYVFAVMLLL